MLASPPITRLAFFVDLIKIAIDKCPYAEHLRPAFGFSESSEIPTWAAIRLKVGRVDCVIYSDAAYCHDAELLLVDYPILSVNSFGFWFVIALTPSRQPIF
jgi:hypothetical protein